ncbi:hypothetical protein INT43_006528 [Umbelopsis isabellina]|uniref:Uncharacterized protein n=1 Tax=Mortierella isabellina TaxID=91625 RepID=A0A8H7PZW8_MORIS|nr:hypothetical protein INT43_006528 [Umbelopsis isabellina]
MPAICNLLIVEIIMAPSVEGFFRYYSLFRVQLSTGMVYVKIDISEQHCQVQDIVDFCANAAITIVDIKDNLVTLKTPQTPVLVKVMLNLYLIDLHLEGSLTDEGFEDVAV